MSDLVRSYVNTNKDLTEEMSAYIASLLDGNVPQIDILTYYMMKFPNGPPITQQDIANQAGPKGHGGSRDAFHLLELLQAKAIKDPEWLIR